MKTMALVLIGMLAVSGVAVQGSRAASMPAESVAHLQCHRAPGRAGQCVRAGMPATEQGEVGDLGFGATGQVSGYETAGLGEAGAGGISPEFLRDALVNAAEKGFVAAIGYLAGIFVRMMADRVFGNADIDGTERTDPGAFDPAW